MNTSSKPQIIGVSGTFASGKDTVAAFLERRIRFPEIARIIEDTLDREPSAAVENLDAVLAAADLVICQTGCISHNAYWRVKDFCKRMGKQCVFVDNPSATSFSRSLRGVQLTAAPTTVAE